MSTHGNANGNGRPPAIEGAPASTVSGSAPLDRAMLAISAVVVLGTIMSILDTTIVNIAINHLSVDFNAPLPTIQWVSTGYLLALATVIPLTGWAADRFGTKRLYMTSLVLFLAGSALSGMAWSAHSLIAFRVLQGLGGGMIMPAGMTILTQAAGPQRVGRVMSVVGAPMLLGPILGPVLGGWLVDDVSWRWIFYVNIPIGAVALVMAYRILKPDKPQPRHRLDVLGLALLSPGLALLVYGLAETGSHGGFSGPRAILPTVAGVLLIAGFVRHALRTEDPLIDVRLFSRRVPAVSGITMSLFAGAFFGAMLLLPLYYQVARGESALDAGLLMIPQGVGAALMMPVGGRIVDRTGAARVVLPGLICVLLGFGIFTQVGADTSYVLLGFASFVTGLGIGLAMMPTMAAAYQTLGRAEVSRATTAFNIVQRGFGALGVALMSVILANQLADRLPGAGNAGKGLQAAQSIPPQARAHLAPLVADAFGHTYVWAFALILVAVIPASFLPRDKPAAPQPVPARAEEAVAVEV
ncbi:MAG TPA: DHA2 family efflux MFS transporter permease subunit [Conexibacter sp.]|jgi:EmrB/QacA subfamily drug resistance transporter|nr:DHA2 family efflux MFS transporter permease subunit [Conexibacter sp.]